MDLSRRTFALAGVAALGLAVPGRAFADAPAVVRQVAVAQVGQAVRVQVAVDRPVSPRTFFLQGPSRFVIDLPATRWGAAAQAGEGQGAGVVRRFRYGPRPDGTTRVVLDLDAPASLVRSTASSRGAPDLSFDLAAVGPVVAPTPRLEMTGRSNRRRTIVIDPGHGGHDPGAIGTTGVREKDVVLDAALKLREALEQRGVYRVELTRDADTFVPLPDRVAFARNHDADLFISLHADSHANPESRGASIYTLSERGANRAQTMAAAQNWDIDLGGARRNGVVGNILMDLAQRDTTNRSAQFAETAIQRLGTVSPLLTNTHRNAGFFVLLAPDVPAVLIETGFLSNAADERRLSDPRQREAIAEAMASAIDGYFQPPRLYAATS